MTLHFRIGELEAASALVIKYHYSHKVPSNIQCVGSWHEDGGLFGDYGPALAACFFSVPGARWAEGVLELCRLVRKDDATVSLTGLIAATCRHLERSREADLLVSFADQSQSHHGGIYQASSWAYDGRRERRLDGIVVDGELVAARTCNHRWGTSSPDKLRQILPSHTIEPHYDEGKHLYWRALGPRGKRKAERLGLKREPYPKPHPA